MRALSRAGRLPVLAGPSTSPFAALFAAPLAALLSLLLFGWLTVPAEAVADDSRIRIEPRQQELPPIFRDARPGPPGRWIGEPVSLSLRDADLVEVLRSFAKLADFNLLVQPGVRGTVTVELDDVPWDQALAAISKMHDLGFDITRGTVRVGARDDMLELAALEGDSLADRQTLRGRLEHVDAVVLAEVLNRPELGLLSNVGHARGRRLEGGGSELVLAEAPARLGRVSRLVARLDQPSSAGDLEGLARRAVELWPTLR